MSSSSRKEPAPAEDEAATLWQSPIGPLEIRASASGLTAVEFAGVPPLPMGEGRGEGADRLPHAVHFESNATDAQADYRHAPLPTSPAPPDHLPPLPMGEGGGEGAPGLKQRASELVDQTISELGQYFAGKLRVFTVPLDLRGTSFQRAVWEQLLALPYGATTTYRELARAAGRPAAIRAAGAANGVNPIAIIVPCHRVIGTNGSLTGYGGGLPLKRYLLDLEHSVLCVDAKAPASPLPGGRGSG